MVSKGRRPRLSSRSQGWNWWSFWETRSRFLHDRENIVVDTKQQWFSKSAQEIQQMIHDELFTNDNNEDRAHQLWYRFEELKLATELSDRELGEIDDQRVDTTIIPSAEKSLLSKPKGSRLSYYEKVYLFRVVMDNRRSMSQIACDYDLSLSTLYNIKRQMSHPSKRTSLDKPTTSRNIVRSPMIQKVVSNYLKTTRTQCTSKDVTTFIQVKLGLRLPERTVRDVMTKELNMSYKKGLSRIVSFDEEHQLRIKQWFAIKLSSLFGEFEVMINVDESSFSRLTKKNFSWIPRGREQII